MMSRLYLLEKSDTRRPTFACPKTMAFFLSRSKQGRPFEESAADQRAARERAMRAAAEASAARDRGIRAAAAGGAAPAAPTPPRGGGDDQTVGAAAAPALSR